jgi:hypothetical protein
MKHLPPQVIIDRIYTADRGLALLRSQLPEWYRGREPWYIAKIEGTIAGLQFALKEAEST